MKFSQFYGTRRFVTVFTTARYQSQSWAGWIQSTHTHTHTHTHSLCISLASTWILSSYRRLVLPSDLFSSRFPIECRKILHTSRMRTTCPVHLITFSEAYKLWSSSFYSFLHHPTRLLLLAIKNSFLSTALMHSHSLLDVFPLIYETKFPCHIIIKFNLIFYSIQFILYFNVLTQQLQEPITDSAQV
jgi:hypothetical protein